MVETSGLNCTLIVSKKPEGAPLNERGIPILVFSLPPDDRNMYLKKWLKVNDASNETLKSIIDWDYYFERFVNIL